MPLKKLHTLDSKSLYKNPYWEYRLDKYTLPDGSTGEYHYLHSPGSSMIVPVDERGRVILVKQYRYLWKRESIEFPAGGIKGGSPLNAAKNELAEEANMAASRWKFVGEYNPFNGATDEVAKVYFATGLRKTKRKKDASEEFKVLRMTVSELQKAIDTSKIWDGMTIVVWIIARPVVLKHIAKLGE